jgi:cytoskeletal protein RodZ
MPEIGTTLREARMRARIDISEIESETKIRAKYLRALENEEWDLLPGPTYVKSFLRTYAQALDLDAKLLLEEYKLRHERPSDHDLMPIAPPRRQQGRGRGREPRGVPRGFVVGVVVVALLGALYLLGRGGGDDEGSAANTIVTQTTPTTTTPPTTTTRRSGSTATGTGRKKRTSRIVRLQVQATGPVFVCLQAAGGRTPINGVNLQSGSSAEFRSSRFRITLGNANARLRVDGRLRRVASTPNGVGYQITKERMRRLSPAQRPSCAPA